VPRARRRVHAHRVSTSPVSPPTVLVLPWPRPATSTSRGTDVPHPADIAIGVLAKGATVIGP